jgi:hypothetical protein
MMFVAELNKISSNSKNVKAILLRLPFQSAQVMCFGRGIAKRLVQSALVVVWQNDKFSQPWLWYGKTTISVSPGCGMAKLLVQSALGVVWQND